MMAQQQPTLSITLLPATTMSFLWWERLWRSFEEYHRWSGRPFGDYTLKLLILPPKFCPLHQTSINQHFTNICPVSTFWKTKEQVCGKKSEPALLLVSAQSHINICSTTVSSSYKLSQLFVLTFGNSSQPLCQQILPWISSRLPYSPQTLWSLGKSTKVTMQHHVCHSYLWSLFFLWVQNASQSHLYYFITVTAWFCSVSSVQSAKIRSQKHVLNNYITLTIYEILTMIKIWVRRHEWVQQTEAQIYNRQSCRPGQLTRKSAM